MDQETKEYLDRKFLGLATRDDVEKLRQETKVNFRQLKEENRGQILERRREVEENLEQLKKVARVEIDPIREEIKEGLRKIQAETESAMDQSNQVLMSSLERIGAEGIAIISRSGQETKADFDRLRERLESLHQAAEEIVLLKEEIKEGLTEVKDELGAMIKFSYADLEKKMNALEARIKALEKMVFP
jgi:F0F1-type ATP synthase membrane subunit b/b'